MLVLRHSLQVFLMFAAVVVLVACSSDSSSGEPEDPPDISVTEILASASEKLAETQTMRFNLEVSGDTWVDEDQTIRLLAATGNLARPDKVDVEFQVELLGTQTVSIRMISIGDEAWTTDLLSGNWQSSPEEFGYNPSVLFDDESGLGPVANTLEDPEVTATETLSGRETWKVEGTVDDATIASLTSETMSGDRIVITLWIDQSTYNILKLQVDEPKSTDTQRPATWEMQLTGHGADIAIEPPDVNE
jgi:hypothetical protein